MMRQLPMVRTLVLVAGFGARQISWSRRTLFLVALLLVPTALAVVIRSEAPPGSIEGFRREALANFNLAILQLMCLFYAGGLVRDAMEDRTLAYLLTRPLGRSRIVFGLYVGMTSLVLPMGLVSAASGFLACRVGLPEGILGRPDLGTALARLLLVTAGAVVFYGALYTLFGLIFRRPTIVSIVFMMVFDVGLASFAGPPRRLSPAAYFETQLSPWYLTRADLTRETSLEAVPIDPADARIVLLILFVLILTLMGVVARRKDLVPFEKATP